MGVTCDDRGPLLVVDDDEDVRFMLTHHLERLGHEVTAVDCGEEGIAFAWATDPRAIFLDLLLPDVHGWEVLRRLREDPRTERTPVVVTSILDRDPETERRLGVDARLDKPFLAADVAAAMQRLASAAQ